MKTLKLRACTGLTFLMIGCNQNILAADAESVVLSAPDFIRPIVLVVGPDDAPSASFLAARGGSIPWWDAMAGIRSCGYSDAYLGPRGGGLNYSVRGYALTQDQWFNWLSKHNYIKVLNFSVVLINSPHMRPIPRNYQCFINLDGTDLQKKVGNVHAGGSFAIGQRQLVKWTFKNSYQTPFPGKGNVKVFAGTFEYRINPLFPNISYTGVGSASAKAYLDPDNGRWVVNNIEMADPSIALLSPGPRISIPPVTNSTPVQAQSESQRDDAAIRKRETVEGIFALAAPKIAVAEFYWAHKRLPDSNEEAGFIPKTSSALQSLSIMKGGVIRGTYPESRGGGNIMLTPVGRDGRVHWVCTGTRSDLPPECR